MILRPPAGWEGRNEEIQLLQGESPVKVGRGQFGIASRTVSREHFSLQWAKEKGSAVRLQHLADNPMRVRTSGGLRVLRKGDECTLGPGDTIFVDGRVSTRAAADDSNHTHAFEVLTAESNHAADASRNDLNWQDWEESDDEEDRNDEDLGAGTGGGCDRELAIAISAVSDDTGLGDGADRRESGSAVATNHGAHLATTPVPAASFAIESGGARRTSAPATPVVSPPALVERPDPAATGPSAATGSSSQLSVGQLLDGLSTEELEALELAAKQPQQQPHQRQQLQGCSALVRSLPAVAAGVDVPAAEPGPLHGLRFAVTGVLEVLTRDECQAMVEKHGGVFQAGGLRKTNRAATGRTTHLIVGTQMEDGRPVETSTKFQQARRSGIRTIKEDDLFAMVAKQNATTRRKRRHSCLSSSPGSSGSPVASSYLHAAAVRAAGGYPLSLFPESDVGTAKRRKLEMLAGHLVVITDELLDKVGIPRPILPVVDEIESSDGEDGEAMAEDEPDRSDDTARRSFRSGGAGLETAGEVNSPAAVAATMLATNRSKNTPCTDNILSNAAVSPSGRHLALSASAALGRTDFVLARDVLRMDSAKDSDGVESLRPQDIPDSGALDARQAAPVITDSSIHDKPSDVISPSGGSESPADVELASDSGLDELPKNVCTSPSPTATCAMHTARSAAGGDGAIDPSHRSNTMTKEQVQGVAGIQGCDESHSEATDSHCKTDQHDLSLASADPVRSPIEASEEQTIGKSPLVPESPLLSWNPDSVAEDFGCTKQVARAAFAGSPQVLVQETQASQRREAEPLFVPETQMHKSDGDAAQSGPVGQLPAQTVRSRSSSTHHIDDNVFVPETQQERSHRGHDAIRADDTVMGWLSQSVEAAGETVDTSHRVASATVADSTRDPPEPTLYAASIAVNPAHVDTGDSRNEPSQSDQDEFPVSRRDLSPLRMFPGDASPMPVHDERLPQRCPTQKPHARASMLGFESGSSSDNDEASQDGRESDALRMRHAELHARRTSNPFAASAILSMNPTQPELSGILRANAAPVPQRKRKRGESPTARSRASGRRPRPVFSWTNKPRQHLPNRLSQQSEPSHSSKQLVNKKQKKQPRQQRLTSWVGK